MKDASRLSCLLLQLGSNDGEASLPEKGATEATSCPKGGTMWRHWYGLTQAWGSTTYDWTLGQILPRSREEGCQQGLTESSVKGKTRVYREGNLTVEEYTYGITRGESKPYGHLAEYRGWPETRASKHKYWAWRQTAPPSLTAGGAGGLHQGSPSGELNWRRKQALVSPGEGEWRSKRDTGQFFPPLTCYPTHGRNWLNAETVESREGVRCRPARSSTDVCQRGAVRQRIGRGNTPCGVSPHPHGARLALGLVRQGDGIHYPVGQPLLGDSLPFLLTTVTDKELLRASEAPGAVHVYAQCSYGTQQRQGWVCLLRRQCLQVHHLIAEGRGGNLGHVSRPGSQDNVRVVRPKHKALFAHRKCLEVPDPLMEVSAVRSAVLADRYPLLTTESSGSQGPLWSPARTIERSQEGLRGSLGGFNLLAPLRNLTMRSCFPRDRPSTASWWAAIAAITLSRWRVTAYAPTFLAGKKALLQSCIFGGLLGEKNTGSRTDSTSVHRLAL